MSPDNSMQRMTENEKKMERTYVVTRRGDQVVSFLFEKNRPSEIHADEFRTRKEAPAIGDIYIGRIKNIAENIGAAFVETAPGQICYLPLDDLKDPIYTKKGSAMRIQQGDELLVQVIREGIKTKAPAVSTNLSLHGKYALLTTGNRSRAVSKKLAKEKKEELLSILEEYESSQEERSFGWLLRTNAGAASKELLIRDLERLKQRYENLRETAAYRTVYSLVDSGPEIWVKRLSDLYSSEVRQIVTDVPEIYREMKAFLSEEQPEDLEKLRFYESDLQSLSKLYSLEHHLKEALQERVWMKSGGYLVIQPTEALTVIDVNSGKSESGKNKEAAFLKLNLEAAKEAAHQIRLRNLSGIILIDFINMKEKESEQTLMELLDRELGRDPVRTVLVDLTKLSLVEITRRKKERPLHEAGLEI